MASSGDWPIDAVWPNDDNPRSEVGTDPAFEGLVASIRSQGIIQPLLIAEDGMILAGHRRYEAALALGLGRVPVRVLRNRESHHLIPLVENLQRADLGVLETADYFLKCNRDYGMSVAAICEATGVSNSTVCKYLKLAEAPKEVRERIERDEIPLNAAFELLRHDHEFINEVIKTPRLTKQIVRERANERDENKPRPAPPMVPFRAGCPTERKAHLEYAIRAIGELLAASPDDVFSVRYKRWITVMEDDLADEENKQEAPSTFRGSVDAFQRQPKARVRA
ncbi:MAG TPA: ParB/RepB/Spo0J family partition protein [Polyangiaceae bacterium]|nr:ParB/RepB/Spo0J family partition protein [Polyangiaceae bacterium]